MEFLRQIRENKKILSLDKCFHVIDLTDGGYFLLTEEKLYSCITGCSAKEPILHNTGLALKVKVFNVQGA